MLPMNFRVAIWGHIACLGHTAHHTMEPPVRFELTPIAYRAIARPLSYGGKLSSSTHTGFSLARLMPQMSILYDSRLLKRLCRAQYFLA